MEHGEWVEPQPMATTSLRLPVEVYPGIPPAPVTAVTVPGNRFTLEGHDLVIVEVGHADTDDNSVLHIPDLGLVVAGDVIYNGTHIYLGESVVVGGFGPWRAAIDKVEALKPRHIVAGHQSKQLDDDAERTIAETRQYLDDADELLRTENTAVDFFNAKVERYPNHLARTVLSAGASALYGVREHPGEDVGLTPHCRLALSRREGAQAQRRRPPIKKHAMSTIHLHETTTATPEQFVAGLTDFGPGRSKLFGNSADEYLKVHDQCPGQADVTEG
jgi:hypothetical protein